MDEDDPTYIEGLTEWSTTDGISFSGAGRTSRKLEAGQYDIYCDMYRGPTFTKHISTYDELVNINGSVSSKIVDGILDFWTKKEIYEQYNFVWKRGILLYGPPGGGKSCTIQLISEEIVERGGIVIYYDSNVGISDTVDCLEIMRSIEPERPLIIIIEDIDNVRDVELTALMDGEDQFNNIVFIGTTNYPEKLAPRVVRPSRFDEKHFIGMPDYEGRKVYINSVLDRVNDKISENELNSWTEKTEGMSLAYIKEVIILTRVFGKSLDESITDVKQTMGGLPSSEDFFEIDENAIYDVDGDGDDDDDDDDDYDYYDDDDDDYYTNLVTII